MVYSHVNRSINSCRHMHYFYHQLVHAKAQTFVGNLHQLDSVFATVFALNWEIAALMYCKYAHVSE